MRRLSTILVILLIFLNSCNFRGIASSSGLSITESPLITQISTAPPTVAHEQCAWNWATQPLPELSSEVQSAMEASGLIGITVRAEAYGENCLTQDNVIAYFAAMETDFRIAMNIASMTNRTSLGYTLEQILVVLDGFPAEETPGPQPGYIGIRFFNDVEELNLWFSVTDWITARKQQLHGRELLDALINQ